MGRVYAVASGKGGVGKTTTVANLGAVLAAGGHETVVVDADLGMGNLSGALGVDPEAGPTVNDVLAGETTVEAAMREGPAGLSVLPASNDLDDFGPAAPANLEALLESIDATVVLLDTSAGLSHDSVEPLRVADEVLLVSTPEQGAIGDTVKTREVAERIETPVAGAVVTRATVDVDPDALADRLGVPVRGTIPEDPSVGVAAEAGEPLLTSAPNAPATAAYRRLAAELTGDESLEPAESDEPAGDEEGGESTEADSEAESTDDTAEASDGDDTDGESDPEAESDDEDGGGGFLRWLLP
ncbi:P-loop NTPase [Haloplanus halobius]|uniref:nucleotide-binding protein n=1 Tax=Haloplanus halobius TaxID=2934938 RepID=UPI00200FDF97|nr:P-loop NTPase [Haloplanus sp. XH21]